MVTLLGPRIPRERGQLVERLVDQLTTPHGRALVVGEHGIGKTSLLEAAVAAGRDAGGVRVLRARAAPGSAPHPYLALYDLLVDVDLGEADIPDSHRQALESVLLLRAPTETVPPGILLVAMDGLVRWMLRRGPVAIVIDDIDDIDQETRELISYIGTRPRADAGVAILVTRTVPAGVAVREPLPTLPFISADQEIVVPSLERGGLTEVLRAHGTEVRAARDAHELYERSGGNPMSALELAARRGDVSSAHVPTSLRSLVEDRISRAALPSRQILTAAALMGPASARQLEAVAGQSPGAVSAAIDDGLVREHDGRITVSHPLLATAVLLSLGDAARKELHGRIADAASDPSDRVHHLDRAQDAGPDESLAVQLLAAGRASRDIGAVGVAIDFLTRSIARSSPASPDLASRTLALAEAQFAASEFGDAVETLGGLALADLTVSQLDRALPLLLTAITAARGESAAKSFLAGAAATVPAEGVRRAIVEVYLAEAVNDPLEARRLAEGALVQLRETREAPISRHRALGALVLADVDEGAGLNEALLVESESLEPELSLLAVNDSALAQRGLYSHQVGAIGESRDALELVHATAVEVGEEVIAGVFSIHLATVDLYAGRRPSADRWLAEWDDVNPWPETPPPSAVFAQGLRMIHNDDEEALRWLVGRPHGPGSETAGHLARLALTGISAARHERWEEALAQSAAAVQTAERAGIREPGRRHWIDFTLARTYVALGRFERAQAIADDLNHLSAGRRRLLDGVAARINGLLAMERKDPTTAVRLLRRSARLLAEEPFTAEHALTLLELARVLQSQRLRAEADEAFASARALARASEDAQLDGAIGRAQQNVDAFTVEASLSERELAVAMAAARGMTNREIAQENFISVRTVETQLSSAYRKLGVRSRSELAALVHREGA